MGKVYGYVRVSSKEQNEERQLVELHKRNVPEEHIYVDKQSGNNFNRLGYENLIRVVKKGDLIYIEH
jgi:DNA invertase Pin-like site-specific DNA recombinase